MTLGRAFYILLFKQEVAAAAAQLLPRVLPYRIPTGGLYWKYNIIITPWINLLKPTGYVMHQQFNIQQLYALSTLYLCVLYLSQNKQRLVPLTA